MTEGESLTPDLWAKQRAIDLSVFVQEAHHARRMRGENEPEKYAVEDWDDLFTKWLLETGRVPESHLSLNREERAEGVPVPAHSDTAIVA